MRGIDKSSYATHKKCGSDMKKMFGEDIELMHVKELLFIAQDQWQLKKEQKPFYIRVLNAIGWHGDETIDNS